MDMCIRTTRSGSSDHRGFSLVEMLIYLGLLAGVFVVLIQAMLPLAESYTELSVARDVSNVGGVAMERMVREIRTAETVDTATSTFGVHPGRLMLEKGTSTTMFRLNNGTLIVEENGTETQLTGNGVTVDTLRFQHATTPHSELVRVIMRVSKQSKEIHRSMKIYDSAVLRGAYTN